MRKAHWSKVLWEKKKVYCTEKGNESEMACLVLVPLVLSVVSPFRKAKVDGFNLDFAILMMLSHCSGVAKFGK